MRLPTIVLLSGLVALAYGAPTAVEEIREKEVVAAPVEPVVAVVEESVLSGDAPSAPIVLAEEAEATTLQAIIAEEEEALADEVAATTIQPSNDVARDGRQLDDEEEEAEDEADADDDDDEDEEEEEDEEEAAASRNQPSASSKNKNKKKVPAPGKPVPQLGEGGVEDDEAEDLGIGFDGSGSAKSDEKASDEKESDEDAEDKEKGDEEESDDEDEDSNEDEERDDQNQHGLVAEPASSETRGDVEDNNSAAPTAIQNEVEQPLAIAVVQNEEPGLPVVPVIVEENSPTAPEVSNAPEEPQTKQKERKNKTKPKKEEEDDDDEDEEEEEEEEEEEAAAARSEKVSQARAVNEKPDILYYYPYPESPMVPEVQQIVQVQEAPEEYF